MLLNQSNQVMLTKVGIFFTFIILLGNIQYVKSLLGFKFRQTFQNIRVSQVFENEIDQSGAQEMTILRQTALLISLWQNIAFPPQENENHVDFKLSDYGLSRNTVRGVISHFQTCKDCAADNAMLIATQDEVDNNDVLRLLATDFPMLSEEDDESWTDYSGVFDGEEDGVGQDDIVTNKSIFPIEGDDSIVLAHTQDWVRKVICDLGVCPFTVSVNKAGIPLGGVRYTVSRARGVDEAFLRFWEDVAALLMSSEKEMSTVLLVFPEIELFGNFELFEAYCDW